MIDAARPTGIEPLGDMPWGTHVCMFYETKDDFLDALVHYFAAGLQSNERCVWAISEPVAEADAKNALSRTIPDFERHLAEGTIEILPGHEWYLPGDRFDMRKITRGWEEKLAAALAEGFDGLRVSGNAFWMETEHWEEFCEYERELDGALFGRPMMVLCTYSLHRSRALEAMDVARAHQFTLARRRGEWEIIETPELRQAKQQILKLKNELEERVFDRTRELVEVNQRLRAENTERERAEAALAKAQTELARVARLTTMGVLAASIAHEINQPLAAIVTNSGAALRWLTNEKPDLAEVNAALGRIALDAHRASEVIQHIRALVTEGRSEHVDVDINDAIRDLVSLMRGMLREHRAVIRLALRRDVPRVAGDRLQLQHAIMNLVNNAAEAMTGVKGRREIVIRTATDKAGKLLVSVEDRGRGLDPDSAEHLFDPFFTTRPEGMGMGLAITRTIIEAHGGRIWASPATPAGTVFRFTLPAAGAASR